MNNLISPNLSDAELLDGEAGEQAIKENPVDVAAKSIMMQNASASQMPIQNGMIEAPTPSPMAPPAPDYLMSGINQMKQSAQLESKAMADLAANEERSLIEQEAAQREVRRQFMENELEKSKLLQQKNDSIAKITQDEAAAIEDAKKDYWEGRSTGAKIGAAIAIALGGFGAGLLGQTENKALTIINDAVERDTQAKIRRINLIKDRKNEEAAKYDSLVAQLGSKDAANNALLAQGLEIAKLKMAQAAAKAKAPMAQAQLRKSLGELDLRIGEIRGQAAQKAAELDQAKSETLVPSIGENVVNKEGASKLNQLSAETMQTKDGITRLLDIAKIPQKSVTPTLKAEAESIAALLQGPLRGTVLGPGTVTPEERAILEKVIANPTRIFGLESSIRTRLNTLMDRVDRNFAMTAKAYGASGNKVPGVSRKIVVQKEGRVLEIPGYKRDDALRMGWSEISEP